MEGSVESKMALRGDDQFYFMLTSDGSMKSYPENKTSSFKIELNDPIDVGDEDWEVALMSVNYPYTWTNVGPAAKVFMKYYINSLLGPQEVVFPDYQSQSMEEIHKFISKQMHVNFVERKRVARVAPMSESQMVVGLDELGRTRITCLTPGYDIGLSDNLLKLLGLAGHPQAQNMRIGEFERRQKCRDIVDIICKEPFTYGDEILVESVKVCESVEQFALLLEPFVTEAHLNAGVYEKLAEITNEEWPNDVERRDAEPGRVPVLGSLAEVMPPSASRFEDRKIGKVFKILMVYLKELLNETKHEWLITGITPGILNPVQRMFIYTNIIQPYDMNDKTVKVLKLINTRGSAYKTTQEEFLLPTYHMLQKGKISLITVFISNEHGEPVSFQSGTVVLTLHFRRAALHKGFSHRLRY